MERLETYKKYAHELMDKGFAYKCYCSQEDLDKKREEALSKDPKSPFKYPGTCRNIKENLDKPYIIRFKAPTEGFTEFTDITFGNRKVPNKENYDFTILRQNGIPLYNFAVVIDDGITDQITHVIRGSDHIKNMVQQILLYQALNLRVPTFCHLPMLLGSNGSKLSKRDGSVSVAEFRQLGYAPGAILNYLVKFGWGYKSQEIFSVSDMVEKFNIEDVHCRDGKFDTVKFLTINYEHLKSEVLTPTDDYINHLQPFLKEKQINISDEQLKPFVPVIRSRAKTFVEAANLLEPMLRDDIVIDQESKQTFTEQIKNHLQSLIGILQQINNWSEADVKTQTQKWLTSNNLALKDIGTPLRLALLGTKNSPELFQVITTMGKEKSIRRIEKSIKI